MNNFLDHHSEIAERDRLTNKIIRLKNKELRLKKKIQKVVDDARESSAESEELLSNVLDDIEAILK